MLFARQLPIVQAWSDHPMPRLVWRQWMSYRYYESIDSFSSLSAFEYHFEAFDWVVRSCYLSPWATSRTSRSCCRNSGSVFISCWAFNYFSVSCRKQNSIQNIIAWKLPSSSPRIVRPTSQVHWFSCWLVLLSQKRVFGRSRQISIIFRIMISWIRGRQGLHGFSWSLTKESLVSIQTHQRFFCRWGPWTECSNTIPLILSIG